MHQTDKRDVDFPHLLPGQTFQFVAGDGSRRDVQVKTVEAGYDRRHWPEEPEDALAAAVGVTAGGQWLWVRWAGGSETADFATRLEVAEFVSARMGADPSPLHILLAPGRGSVRAARPEGAGTSVG
jgi:hypothetical protein